MSKKVDENYFHDEREEDEEEDKKCPPQRISSLNPNQEWAASHQPKERTSATRFNDNPREPSMKLHADKKKAEIHNHKEQPTMQSSTRPERHEGQRNVTPKHEAGAIEEAVLFDEKKEIKGGTDGHVLASNVYQMSVSPKDRNTPHGTFRGGHMVSASRGPDYSLGAESVDIQGFHCPKAAENRRRWDQALSASLPGAFQEGYHDIEEGHAEDEFTVTAEEENEEQAPVVTREKSIKPVSADLVNEEEEGRRLQEKINEALERERQQAVVAEVVPATRRRHRFIVAALLLLVVVAIATLLGLELPEKSDYPNCKVPNQKWIGNGHCDGDEYNTTECEWDGRDCLPCDDGKFGPSCEITGYPNCIVSDEKLIGDGHCDGEPFNTEECGWDGGDCCAPGLVGPNCDVTIYPKCAVPVPNYIGNGDCDGQPFNTEECGWDGGDCCAPDSGLVGPFCNNTSYPNCTVPIPNYIGDGICDGEPFNTEECGWDGGDCVPCNDGFFGPICNITGYPNCTVPYNKWIGDGYCDYDEYNTTECGWDGGDCLPCDDGFFGPSCIITGYPNCTVPDNKRIGDGICNGDEYNMTECGWDGGDCLLCDDGYYGYNCTLYYPDCLVSNLEWIETECEFGNDPVTYTCFYRSSDSVGDGFCDGDPFNTEECGWDSGDCCTPGLVGPFCNNTSYPNCSVPFPDYIGDGTCDYGDYNTSECGWDGGDCVYR